MAIAIGSTFPFICTVNLTVSLNLTFLKFDASTCIKLLPAVESSLKTKTKKNTCLKHIQYTNKSIRQAHAFTYKKLLNFFYLFDYH